MSQPARATTEDRPLLLNSPGVQAASEVPDAAAVRKGGADAV